MKPEENRRLSNLLYRLYASVMNDNNDVKASEFTTLTMEFFDYHKELFPYDRPAMGKYLMRWTLERKRNNIEPPKEDEDRFLVETEADIELVVKSAKAYMERKMITGFDRYPTIGNVYGYGKVLYDPRLTEQVFERFADAFI